MQTSTKLRFDLGIPGQDSDIVDLDKKISREATEKAYFGRACAESGTTGTKGAMVLQNGLTYVMSADFVTTNTLAGAFTLTPERGAGTVGSPLTISEAFDTNHATTVANVVAAMDALTGIGATLDASDATSRTINITADSADDLLLVSTAFAITGGASQATIAMNASTQDDIIGVSSRDPKEAADDNTASYSAGSMMSLKTRGRMYVTVGESVNTSSPVYCYALDGTANKQRGMFAASSDGGAAVLFPNAKYRSAAAAGAVAELELNNP